MAFKIYSFVFVAFLLVSCRGIFNHETNRQPVHFTSGGMSHGVPSALVHDGKQFHLFFQGKINGDENKWAQTSGVDLVHWEKSTPLLLPDSASFINSAGFVIDWDNTSGLAKGGQKPLIAIYQTVPEYVQKLAFSYDFGKTWAEYSDRQVSFGTTTVGYKISKIIWHEESQKWILVATGRDHVRLYSSENLIDWQLNSTFTEVLDYISGEWDHVDFFPLIDKENNKTKWILMVSYHSLNPSSGAGTRSIIGDFDGIAFNPVHEKIKSVDYGSDNFAGVTALANNNCYHIGCISNSTDTSRSANSFTLPRKLSLTRNFNGYVVQSSPVEEFDQFRRKKHLIAETNLKGILAVNRKLTLPYELDMTFNLNKLQWLNFAENFGAILISDQGDTLTVAYNHTKRVFYVDRRYKEQGEQAVLPIPVDYGPYIANQETLDIRIIIDYSSVELFSGDGHVVMTEKLLPNKEFSNLKLFAEGGEITLKEARVYNLNN